jgi:hypothetical protein
LRSPFLRPSPPGRRATSACAHAGFLKVKLRIKSGPFNKGIVCPSWAGAVGILPYPCFFASFFKKIPDDPEDFMKKLISLLLCLVLLLGVLSGCAKTPATQTDQRAEGKKTPHRGDHLSHLRLGAPDSG